MSTIRINDYEPYANIVSGLHAVAQEVGRFDAAARKVLRMQEIYLGYNPTRYSATQQAAMNYYLRAHLYKAQVAQLYLEQLWSLRHAIDVDPLVHDILVNVCDEHDFGDQSLFLASHLLDGYLIQAKAAYDFMLLHFNAYLGFEPSKRFSGEQLQKNIVKLKRERRALVTPAKALNAYIDEELWNCNALARGNWHKAWGKVVTELRNAMVHRDRTRPDFTKLERLVDRKLAAWPALKSLTCSRFSQDIGNCQFQVWSELIPILFDLPWIPGPYRDDLWDRTALG